MKTLIVAAASIVISAFVLFIYNRFKKINLTNIRIKEALDNIELLYEKELISLKDVSKILNKTSKEKIMKELNSINRDTMDIFEIDSISNNLLKEYKEILLINNKIKYNKDELQAFNDLNNNTIEIKSLKLYYNKNTKIYNKLINNILFKFIKILKKYRTKKLFEIPKEVDFEILKD